LSAGIEHIFLGYDHIAFLLALILWGRSLCPLVKVVTAFTLAHSLTLCLAVLDIVRLPSGGRTTDRSHTCLRRGREFLRA
jgi:hydrogenase/urease accessory protein HupE